MKLCNKIYARRQVQKMNNLVQKGQIIFNKYIGFFFLAVFFLWMKTYIAQLTQFDLGIENSITKISLIFKSVRVIFIIFRICFFFKGRKKYIALIVIDFFLSFLLYANILYYRFFNDFITLPTLTQTQNFGDVSGSVGSLLKPYDFLFFIDIVLLIGLLAFRFVKIEVKDMNRGKVAALFSLSLAISLVKSRTSRNRSSSIINKRI